MKKKVFLIILTVSLILTFAIAPLRMFYLFENPSLYLGTLIRGIVFWAVTVYFLTKYSGVMKSYQIVLLALLADLVPDIIVRIFMGHFIIALPSFPDTVLQIIAVLLGWWYTRVNKKRKVMLALVNLLVCIGVSSYGFAQWNKLDFVENRESKKLEVVEILNLAGSTSSQDNIMNKIQHKNFVVYVGGEDGEKNKIGLAFLEKVQKEFEGSNGTTALALICLDNPEGRAQNTQLLKNTKCPVISMARSNSQLKRSALYYWYVVDRNEVIRWRKKIRLQENSDIQKEQNELQFIKELIIQLNADVE